MWLLHAILLPMIAVTGALVGSFANVCIYRLPWEKSVIWPPSCCPRCLAFIEPRDNVPVVGYLVLGGAAGRAACRSRPGMPGSSCSSACSSSPSTRST